MNAQALTVMALITLAAAMLVAGGSLLLRARMQGRHAKSADSILAARSASNAPRAYAGMNAEEATPPKFMDRIAALGAVGVASSIGRQLVAEDDRKLLDTCGLDNPRGRALFFIARALLGIGLPFIAWFIWGRNSIAAAFFAIFVGFAVGYMAPKMVMRRYAANRKRLAADELPLLIDLLRLLQGVGLSIDQSLHLIQSDFSNVLPVLSHELEFATLQYSRGRPREASLQRFATVFENDDIGSIARLIVQVDRYGGAVQEPLRQFSERIRESRKLEMKAKIGQLTVKMTAVMVLTLLPALLIVTGGAGFLAVFRALGRMGGHG